MPKRRASNEAEQMRKKLREASTSHVTDGLLDHLADREQKDRFDKFVDLRDKPLQPAAVREATVLRELAVESETNQLDGTQGDELYNESEIASPSSSISGGIGLHEGPLTSSARHVTRSKYADNSSSHLEELFAPEQTHNTTTSDHANKSPSDEDSDIDWPKSPAQRGHGRCVHYDNHVPSSPGAYDLITALQDESAPIRPPKISFSLQQQPKPVVIAKKALPSLSKVDAVPTSDTYAGKLKPNNAPALTPEQLELVASVQQLNAKLYPMVQLQTQRHGQLSFQHPQLSKLYTARPKEDEVVWYAPPEFDGDIPNYRPYILLPFGEYPAEHFGAAGSLFKTTAPDGMEPVLSVEELMISQRFTVPSQHQSISRHKPKIQGSYVHGNYGPYGDGDAHSRPRYPPVVPKFTVPTLTAQLSAVQVGPGGMQPSESSCRQTLPGGVPHAQEDPAEKLARMRSVAAKLQAIPAPVAAPVNPQSPQVSVASPSPRPSVESPASSAYRTPPPRGRWFAPTPERNMTTRSMTDRAMSTRNSPAMRPTMSPAMSPAVSPAMGPAVSPAMSRASRASRASTSSRNTPPRMTKAVPVPRDAYLRVANQPATKLNKPQPLLVIMDLNGTLLDRNRNSKDRTKFIERPFLEEFLSFIFGPPKDTLIYPMIWTSSKPENCSGILDQLLTPERRARCVAVWARDRLGLSSREYLDKVQVYKNLEQVWLDNSIQQTHPLWSDEQPVWGTWGQHNTLLIDDSVLKGAWQPHNLVNVMEFKRGNLQMERRVGELQRVVEWIKVAREYADVSVLGKGMPFGPVDV